LQLCTMQRERWSFPRAVASDGRECGGGRDRSRMESRSVDGFFERRLLRVAPAVLTMTLVPLFATRIETAGCANALRLERAQNSVAEFSVCPRVAHGVVDVSARTASDAEQSGKEKCRMGQLQSGNTGLRPGGRNRPGDGTVLKLELMPASLICGSVLRRDLVALASVSGLCTEGMRVEAVELGLVSATRGQHGFAVGASLYSRLTRFTMFASSLELALQLGDLRVRLFVFGWPAPYWAAVVANFSRLVEWSASAECSPGGACAPPWNRS